MTIQAVTLDFWGTLVVDGPGADERYRAPRLHGWQRVLAGAGCDVSAAALGAAYDASLRILHGVWRNDRDVAVAYHVEAILASLDPAIAPALDVKVRDALVEAYAAPLSLVPPAFDGAADTILNSLRARGYLLGIISNVLRTPGRVLRDLLAARGLLSLFTAITFSDEAEWRKPAKQIFALTLERLAVSPAAAVHVGDDEILDVAGARQAGLGSVLVCDSPTATATEADVTIGSLAELPAAIERLERQHPR